MRTVLRYENGRTIWSDSVPASTGSSRLGGELVQGDHGPVEQGRIQSRAQRARETALRGERLLEARAAKSKRFVAGKDAA